MAETDSFEIKVELSEDVATLIWAGQTTLPTLQRAIGITADDIIIDKGARRVQVAIDESDQLARTALQRAGFRREGIKRDAILVDEQPHDVWIYSRLARDSVYTEDSKSAVLDSFLPQKRIISHVRFTDEVGRILYCQTSYKDHWELPGGICEPNESPYQTAVREIQEEWQVSFPVGQLLCVDYLPAYKGWSDAVQFVFDGGSLTESQIESIHPDGKEILAVHRVALEDVAEHTYPAAVCRMNLLQKHTGSFPLYLESGKLVNQA